jgi:hypothetical protein
MFWAEAMDRIHRLGQRRPVQAIKLVVEDSIESRIVQVSGCEVALPCEPLNHVYSFKKRRAR